MKNGRPFLAKRDHLVTSGDENSSPLEKTLLQHDSLKSMQTGAVIGSKSNILHNFSNIDNTTETSMDISSNANLRAEVNNVDSRSVSVNLNVNNTITVLTSDTTTMNSAINNKNPGASISTTVINVCKNVLGSALLNLPWTFYEGSWFLAIAVMVFMGVLNALSFWILGILSEGIK